MTSSHGGPLAAPSAKICGDGSSNTLVSVVGEDISDPPVSLRIAEAPPGGDPETYGSFKLIEVHSDPDSLVFVFTHPKDPDILPSLDHTFCILDVVDENDDVLAWHCLEFYRTPVLMLHGLWATGPDTFDRMIGSLNGLWNHYSDALLSNPSYRNDVDFFSNRNVASQEVANLLLQAQASGYSAGKVDIVCHSMGGIVARLYLQGRADSAYRGDVNRLITANTPHWGKPDGQCPDDTPVAMQHSESSGKRLLPGRGL